MAAGAVRPSDAGTTGRACEQLEVAFVPNRHADAVAWRVGEGAPFLTRYLGERPQVDEDGLPLRAAAVAVVQALHRPLGDDAGRLDIRLNGNGEALVFVGGTVYEATWRGLVPASAEPAFRFQVAGRVLTLPNPVWIEVVPDIGRVRCRASPAGVGTGSTDGR
ncbi:MAG: DUF3048 C-terminal domain-containing protein [Clostridia bacterium]|nr:DUF3048 C-terminal domain-containing protein [Clostridia bacterium]